MNEFSLIDRFFKKPAILDSSVIYGIGDDAACLHIDPGQELLISTDTLVAEVHFLSTWKPYDIAWKAVMVNVSDMAAMAALPKWLTLALTLPKADEAWLENFSQGLHEAMRQFNLSLIGGDTTRGPLSLTLTILGLAEKGQALRRSGAKAGDSLWISGPLGLAALALRLDKGDEVDPLDFAFLQEKLQHPYPRVDLRTLLQRYASAAIDISDGLSADLAHICQESQVGALLDLEALPIDPRLKKYAPSQALELILGGGDDYELCFTVPKLKIEAFKQELIRHKLCCYQIGVIEKEEGLRAVGAKKVSMPLSAKGYSHF